MEIPPPDMAFFCNLAARKISEIFIGWIDLDGKSFVVEERRSVGVCDKAIEPRDVVVLIRGGWFQQN